MSRISNAATKDGIRIALDADLVVDVDETKLEEAAMKFASDYARTPPQIECEPCDRHPLLKLGPEKRAVPTKKAASGWDEYVFVVSVIGGFVLLVGCLSWIFRQVS